MSTPDACSSVISETRHRREPVQASCSGCTTRWTPSGAAHCPTCHLTFGSITGFDCHRIGGGCLGPDDLRARGYELSDTGLWRRPRPAETLPDGEDR